MDIRHELGRSDGAENGTEWRILEEGDVPAPVTPAPGASEHRSALQDLQDIQAAKETAETIMDVRMGFRDELEELGDRVMDKEAFEGYEDELLEYYEEMQGYTRHLRPETAAKAEAAATDIAFREKTTVRGDGAEKHLIPIEAYAGHFMRERIDALRKAIEDAAPEDKDKLIEQIESFYATCLEHSKYLNVDTQMNMSAEAYEENRTKAHNAVIIALNGLNDLCRRFDVRPLTIRNFEDTEGANAEVHNQEQIDRKKADRGMAELYYSIAFKDLAEQATLPDFDDEFQVVKYFHELGKEH